MSALGHMLEERGFATVAIAGVRAQAEKVRPPRALWTAAELGRPLGAADAGFQRRVLLAALRLLERTDGPVILEDLPDEPPGLADVAGWRAPELTAPATRPETPADWEQAFAAELRQLAPLQARAVARFGRSSVGLSFQAPNSWPGFAAAVLAGALPTVPGLDTTALAVRFLCDDVKAFYAEAAQADGPPPSSRQVDGWFWRHTCAGALLLALREAAMASDDRALATVGGRFFVPTPWLPK